MRKGTVLKILDDRYNQIWRRYKVVRHLDGDVFLCRCLTGDKQRKSTLWAKSVAEFQTDSLDPHPAPFRAVKVLREGSGKELKRKAAVAAKVVLSWREALHEELKLIPADNGWKGRLLAALDCQEFENEQPASHGVKALPVPPDKRALRQAEKDKQERVKILQYYAAFSTPAAAQTLNLKKEIASSRVASTDLKPGQVIVEASGNWSKVVRVKKIRGDVRVKLRRLCREKVVTRETLTNKQLLRLAPSKLVRRYTGKGQ